MRNFQTLVRTVIQEENIQIDPARAEALTLKVVEKLEETYPTVTNEIINDEEYGMENVIKEIQDRSEDDLSQITELTLEHLINLHIESLDWPKTEQKSLESIGK